MLANSVNNSSIIERFYTDVYEKLFQKKNIKMRVRYYESTKNANDEFDIVIERNDFGIKVTSDKRKDGNFYIKISNENKKNKAEMGYIKGISSFFGLSESISWHILYTFFCNKATLSEILKSFTIIQSTKNLFHGKSNIKGEKEIEIIIKYEKEYRIEVKIENVSLHFIVI